MCVMEAWDMCRSNEVFLSSKSVRMVILNLFFFFFVV